MKTVMTCKSICNDVTYSKTRCMRGPVRLRHESLLASALAISQKSLHYFCSVMRSHLSGITNGNRFGDVKHGEVPSLFKGTNL